MAKVAALLLAILCFQTILTFNIIAEPEPNDDRVKVDFFFESLCPYCQQFIVGSLKTAAATKVSIKLFRISGRSVTSIYTLTEMPDAHLMEQVGVSVVNMEFVNAKEISSNHALLVYMINTLKPCPSLSALKLIPTIGLLRERNVQLNMG